MTNVTIFEITHHWIPAWRGGEALGTTPLIGALSYIVEYPRVGVGDRVDETNATLSNL